MKSDQQALAEYRRKYKQATPSAELLGAWMRSDGDIIQDIYQAALKASQPNSPPPPNTRVDSFLLREFQFGKLLAFSARREVIPLEPIILRAASTQTTLSAAPSGAFNDPAAPKQWRSPEAPLSSPMGSIATWNRETFVALLDRDVSLTSLLQQTFLHATGGPIEDSFRGAPRLTPLSSTDLQELTSNPEQIQKKRIWEYQHPTLDTVIQVTARHRNMWDMAMPVLDSIHWGEVGVKPLGAPALRLPLTERFLIKTQSVNEGVIKPSEQGLWQLPANVHSSFHHLFGYEISSTSQVRPIPGAEGLNRFTLGDSSPLRVLVCMALGCTGERNEFEPGGVLGAARLMPHLMLVTNKPVESVEGAITLTRNERTPHLVMGDDEMAPAISAGLYTDNNDKTVTPDLPFWNLLFDYYSTDPAVGTFEVVKRGAVRRTAKDAVKYLHEEIGASMMGSFPAGASYRARDVIKEARQGEFDNIHLAPKMKLPWEAVAKSPREWSLAEPVSMAPFCVHDCFHTHWRWGNLLYDPFDWFDTNPKWVRGWGKGSPTTPGVPYSEAGAPLVPCNQDVTLQVLSQRSFKYFARAHAPVAGQWQVLMHHGSAYAINATGLAEMLKSGLGAFEGPPFAASKGSWARFYWGLRYGTYVARPFADPRPRLPATATGIKFAERLQLDATTLARLRAL